VTAHRQAGSVVICRRTLPVVPTGVSPLEARLVSWTAGEDPALEPVVAETTLIVKGPLPSGASEQLNAHPRHHGPVVGNAGRADGPLPWVFGTSVLVGDLQAAVVATALVATAVVVGAADWLPLTTLVVVPTVVPG
jgi:hypothetical protein